jgi:hypothetical protein
LSRIVFAIDPDASEALAISPGLSMGGCKGSVNSVSEDTRRAVSYSGFGNGISCRFQGSNIVDVCLDCSLPFLDFGGIRWTAAHLCLVVDRLAELFCNLLKMR